MEDNTKNSEPETETYAEQLLEKAARLQGEYWDAVSELEAELGIEIDSTQDLGACSIEGLTDEAGDDEEDEEDEDGK